jgi:hypothetical protein
MNNATQNGANKMKTTVVKIWNQRVEAYYQDGQVWVWDDVAGHYTTCHSLTAGQVRYVKGRADNTEVK